ncbi:ATP-binding protein [Streptomyces sp. NPDC054813]
MARIQAGELVPAEGGGRPPSSTQEISRVVAALHNVERTAVGLAAEQAVLRRNTAESLASLGTQPGARAPSTGPHHRPRTAGARPRGAGRALRTRPPRDPYAPQPREPARPRRRTQPPDQQRDRQQPRTRAVRHGRGRAVPTGRLAEIEPRRISGRAVAELSHLLAELVENALPFSPPDQPVDVHGWGDGDDYCIAVVDHGVGMSPEGLARANARISGEEAFLVAPTRYLGHYVVGRLARRLGVEVLLSGHPRRGRIRSRHPPRPDPRPRRGPAASPADARLLHARRVHDDQPHARRLLPRRPRRGGLRHRSRRLRDGRPRRPRRRTPHAATHRSTPSVSVRALT